MVIVAPRSCVAGLAPCDIIRPRSSAADGRSASVLALLSGRDLLLLASRRAADFTEMNDVRADARGIVSRTLEDVGIDPEAPSTGARTSSPAASASASASPARSCSTRS